MQRQCEEDLTHGLADHDVGHWEADWFRSYVKAGIVNRFFFNENRTPKFLPRQSVDELSRMPLAATFLSDYENVSVVSIFIAMVISPRMPPKNATKRIKSEQVSLCFSAWVFSRH